MDRALGGRVHYTVQPSSLQNNSAAPTWSELLSSRQFNSVQCFVRLNVFILFVLFCFHFFLCGCNVEKILRVWRTKWSLNTFTVALHAHACKVVCIHAVCVVVHFFFSVSFTDIVISSFCVSRHTPHQFYNFYSKNCTIFLTGILLCVYNY